MPTGYNLLRTTNISITDIKTIKYFSGTLKKKLFRKYLFMR